MVDPGRGLETRVHLPGSGALPLLARSRPLNPQAPRTASSDLSIPRSAPAHGPEVQAGGRVSSGGRGNTHTLVETRCKARGRRLVHLTTGAAAAPTAGCTRAADTRVWQAREALDAVSLPDGLGHALRVCLATRLRGKIRLSHPRQTDV